VGSLENCSPLTIFIEVWTLGGIISVSMNYAFLSRKVGLILPSFDFSVEIVSSLAYLYFYNF
jgi:hypothetical protein